MLKAEIRPHYLSKRRLLNDEHIETKSLQIRDRLLAFFDFRTIRTVHCFLSIAKHKEINTWPIIKALSDNVIAVSKSNFEHNTLTHFVLDESVVLKENRWGIPEPVHARPIHEHKIDMVLVPLLAFDKNGFRVGYGKGFYDRFLNNCREDVLKVGLSMEPHIEKISDISEHDVSLDFCVTPGRVYVF
ncbi:MAG: 5-formyltetrahydrofolate cyclo-ligase [Cytophagales bacterium]|nr:5-formyltetrahydrofolate cyclo-ligase [Cytophagales bacterium]